MVEKQKILKLKSNQRRSFSFDMNSRSWPVIILFFFIPILSCSQKVSDLQTTYKAYEVEWESNLDYSKIEDVLTNPGKQLASLITVVKSNNLANNSLKLKLYLIQDETLDLDSNTYLGQFSPTIFAGDTSSYIMNIEPFLKKKMAEGFDFEDYSKLKLIAVPVNIKTNAIVEDVDFDLVESKILIKN